VFDGTAPPTWVMGKYIYPAADKIVEDRNVEESKDIKDTKNYVGVIKLYESAQRFVSIPPIAWDDATSTQQRCEREEERAFLYMAELGESLKNTDNQRRLLILLRKTKFGMDKSSELQRSGYEPAVDKIYSDLKIIAQVEGIHVLELICTVIVVCEAGFPMESTPKLYARLEKYVDCINILMVDKKNEHSMKNIIEGDRKTILRCLDEYESEFLPLLLSALKVRLKTKYDTVVVNLYIRTQWDGAKSEKLNNDLSDKWEYSNDDNLSALDSDIRLISIHTYTPVLEIVCDLINVLEGQSKNEK